MVNIKAILAAIFCATAPVSAVLEAAPSTEPRNGPGAELVQSGHQLGKETVSTIRSNYASGAYQPFFEEVNASYEKADLSGLIQMRSNQVPIEFQEDAEAKFVELQREKGQALLNAIPENDSSDFAEKVRSAASNPLTLEQEKAISKLNSFISMTPNSGANADENRLIEIDLEYEYKLLHADLPTKDISSQERKEQSIALRMEKMDKMVAASKTFQDLELKKAVGIAADTLDVRLARNLDGSDLNNLLKANTKPLNQTEERVITVLSLYQEKFSDLLKSLSN